MSVIVEAALSSLFQVLFDKISSTDLLNFATEAQVRDEIQGWELKLQTLSAVLDDAEDKQIQTRSVKLWLVELKHLAYDVEDVLDEFATECLRRKLKGEGHHQDDSASSSKIHKLIPACCAYFSPRALMFNTKMMSKVKEITARFEGILKDMQQLNLVERNIPTTTSRVSKRLSTNVVDEPIIYGRDDDKAKIVEWLLSPETGDTNFGVITIVGMGGLGKTTLARHVYNDSKLDHFQVKAWVCVSDVFDLTRVTNGILNSIKGTSDLKELSVVQPELERQLAGRKFLLVLDDVWTEDYNDWHNLRAPLLVGAPGSKIIVTTRSAIVADKIGTSKHWNLNKISDEHCWLLFKQHASVANLELENIGREIVEKRCDGLPLASRTLGGLLLGEKRRSVWEEVLNNKLWSVLDGNGSILSVLELSYYYLPSHLKRCFAYCAVLPKDYEFKQEEIVLLWMAEGLIAQSNDGRKMEDLGGDYFGDLLSRSFFQASTVDQSRFVMHDLVNDLAQKVAGDVCLKLEEEGNIGKEVLRKRVRHSSYIRAIYRCEATTRFATFRNMECLRTFLPLSHYKQNGRSYLANCVPDELLKNLKCLRVLSFCGYIIEELPDSIGDLKHLRYLDLSFTDIKLLPESVTSLCNLETLILRHCRNLRKLPLKMDNLINLFYLDMEGVDLIEGIPLKIRDLRSLRALCNIVIYNEFFPFSNMGSLKSLRGELSLRKLNTLVDALDAVNAKLKDKEGIRVLRLGWETFNTGLVDGGVHFDVLQGLQPHQNIEELNVVNYGGTKFPCWMGDPMFKNMVKLRLGNCQKCTSMPQLGMLPNLKKLFIEGMSSIERVDRDFYGNNGFPCLEVLHFERMDNWEEWNAFELEFPVLRKLSITNCEKLVVALPSLPMLSVLEIKSCKEMDFRSIVDFNSLTKASLVDISSFTNLTMKEFVQRLKKSKEVEVWRSGTNWNLKFEREWEIDKCPQLTGMVLDEDKDELVMEFVGSEVESLELAGCGMLVKLPIWIRKMSFLKKLTLVKCESLAELTVHNCQCLGELTIKYCGAVISLGRRQLPPTLKKLEIDQCENLKKLLDEEDEGETYPFSINLEDLKIRSCESLTSFSSTRELPVTLKHLHVFDCSNLRHVLCRGKLPSELQTLEIRNCEKIESIAERFDSNSSLEILTIEECSSLKSLPEGLDNLVKLCKFLLSDCPCFESFKLPTTCLTTLESDKLPDNSLNTLSSLQELDIPDYPNLRNQGLPSNLTTLTIPIRQLYFCRLERLCSLRELYIYGEIGESRRVLWDNTETMLPPSLTLLSISGFPNLKYIHTRDFSNLTSLETLYIWSCPKLASFSKNGFPDSLLELNVYDCPILKQRCNEGKRPEWSNIRHIPKVEFS